jgi:hypothetical protein
VQQVASGKRKTAGRMEKKSVGRCMNVDFVPLSSVNLRLLGDTWTVTAKASRLVLFFFIIIYLYNNNKNFIYKLLYLYIKIKKLLLLLLVVNDLSLLKHCHLSFQTHKKLLIAERNSFLRKEYTTSTNINVVDLKGPFSFVFWFDV